MRLAVVTLAIGRAYQAICLHTHPGLRRYAERCNAEFIVIDQPLNRTRLGLATYEKLQLHDLLTEYDRIAYVDSDILIAPDAPNVFDLVPSEAFGACTEEHYSKATRDRHLTQEVLGPVDWQGPYFNSGMMVVGRSHRDVFKPDNPDLMRWATGAFRAKHVNLLNDQPFFNHRVRKLGIPVHDLGVRFNHTRAIPSTHFRFRSFFIHYAGPSGHRYGSRVEQIRKDAAVLNSPLRLWLSRKLPSYRWVADRCDMGFLAYQWSKFQSSPAPAAGPGRYRIFAKDKAQVIAELEADSAQHALDKFAISHGYLSHAEAERKAPQFYGSQLHVEPIATKTAEITGVASSR